MKVVHVFTSLRPSGMERMLVSSAKHWKQEGVASVVIGCGRQHEYVEQLASAGYTVIALPGLKSLRTLARIWLEIRRQRPDVVHLHTEQMFGVLSVISKFAGAANVVRTFHNIWAPSGLWLWRRRCERKVASLLGVKFVGVSAEVCRNEELLHGTKTRSIENWVDLDELQVSDIKSKTILRNRIGLPGPSAVAIIIGNCSEIKNHEFALEVLQPLDERIFLLHIGGESGATDLERSLWLDGEKLLLRLGHRDDIKELLGSADVLLMPSRHEGFGVAAAEAMCMGVPVLAAATPGLGWLDELDGAHRAPLQPEVWREKLSEIVRSKQTPSPEALAEVRLRFSPARGVSEYMQVYEASPGLSVFPGFRAKKVSV